MKLAVIGTGYVGLVTGTCFAESGNDVVGIDKDADKVRLLDGGGLPIYEPGLLELVQRNRREGRLRFTTDLAEGIREAQLVFIAVGTPQGDDGAADLSAVFAVADAIGDALNGPKTVVIKSTVPVGTNAAVAERIARRTKTPFDVTSNPEFLKEGAAVEDCMKPDRVVIGVRRLEVAEVLRELYAPFLRTERPFLVMSPESAEMTKYVANAMLATKISFINEMANLCERMGADINDVRRGIGHDARIGFQFLFPGAGYGGSCFLGGETVFTVCGGEVRARTLREVFEEAGEPLGDGRAALVRPNSLRVLAFDAEAEEPCVAEVLALTRRKYRGVVVHLKTGMGRRLAVTEDHPVIVFAGHGFGVVPAADVIPGDRLATVCTLPPLEQPQLLNLIELLRGTTLAADVHVSPTDESFRERWEQFRRHIPKGRLSCPWEIRRHNRMPLDVYHHLHDAGVLSVPPERLQLYTAKGAATKVNALIPIDADLLRLLGYYAAEGFISQDVGRAGAVRDRIGFTFNENETDYIADVRRILGRWGMKWGHRRGPGAISTVVSSRVFTWLLRDVLHCGIGSEDKTLPTLGFNSPAALRMELIRGAFSGDGSATTVQKGKNLMLEYGTVSKRLADGLVLLLQSVGVVPSVRVRWMKKSKQPAYILRVSGYEQMRSLAEVLGVVRGAKIERVLAGYQRHIRQHGFEREDGFALVRVREVQREDVSTDVYSLETTTGTVVVGPALVCHNCFPKDVTALMFMANNVGLPSQMMSAVHRINEAQKQVLVSKIQKHYGDALKDKTLAIWGLAFKPRTDDIREAPSLVLLDALLEAGVKCRVHDSEAMPNVRKVYGDRIVYCDRPYGALEGADGLVIVTEWQEFRNPDFEIMRRLLREKVIFDGRNLYEPRQLQHLGFTYYAIGRKVN